MASNTIIVNLSANDKASGEIKKLAKLIDDLSKKSKDVGSSSSMGFGKMSSAVAVGNIAANTLMVTMGMLKDAAVSFGNAFQKAADIEVSNILTSGGLMDPMGKSFSEASKFVDQLNDRMIELAAALPGATSDYTLLARGLADNLVPAFKDANGVVEESKMLEWMDAVASKAGILANGDFVNMQKALSKMLSGNATLNQIKNLDVIGIHNPALFAALEKQVEEYGDFNEVSTDVAAEMVQNAFMAALPDEAQEKLLNTGSAIIEGFKSRMFDPMSGIFGLARDIDKETEGSQSVLTAINKTLKSVLGDNGTFSRIGNTLNLLFGWDDKTFLKSSMARFESMNRFVARLNNNIDKINRFLIKGGSLLDASTQFLEFPYLAESIKEFSNTLMEKFNNFLGVALTLDWGMMGSKIGTFLAENINAMVKGNVNPDTSKIGALFLKISQGFINGLASAVFQLDWGTLALQSANLFGSMMILPFTAMGELLGDEIDNLGKFASKVLSSNLERLSDLGENFTTWLGSLSTGFIGLFNKVLTWINQTADRIPIAGSIINIPLIEVAPTSAQASVNVPDDKPMIADGVNIKPRFGGMFPSGAIGSLIQAATQEIFNKPNGADLAVANSSEAILNQQQQRTLAANLGSVGGSSAIPSLSIGNITIQTAATDAASIARDVMGEIEREYLRFVKTRLSNVGVS